MSKPGTQFDHRLSGKKLKANPEGWSVNQGWVHNLDILGQEKNKKQGEEKIDFKFTVSVPCEEGMQKSSLRLGQAREKLLLPSLLHGGGDLGAIRSRCWVATMDWGG